MRKIKIGNKIIGGDNPAFVIAEAGCNHDCMLDRGKKLVEAAAKSGFDAIKFQNFKSEKLVTKTVPKFWVDDKKDKTQMSNYIGQDKLDRESYRALARLANKLGIIYLSTPFDEEEADFLEELKVPAYKIASTDLTNLPFLKYVAKKGKPILLSVGMGSIGEIEEAIEAVKSTGNEEIVLLHCIVIYPTPPEQANLRFIKTLQNLFPEYPVGFSDHTLGIVIPAIAASLGAKVIEKHFTIDKNMKGSPDHPMSVDPDEAKEMIQAIKVAEVCMGSPVRRLLEDEKKAYELGRRKIVANENINKGTVIERNMIVCKRSEEGIAPKFMDIIIGRRASRHIKMDEGISWEKIM